MESYVSIKEFSSKFSDKKEIYDFVSQNCNLFVPPKECVSIYHLKMITSGEKKCLNCDDVKVKILPFFETLTIEKILEWVKSKHPEFHE